MDHFVVFGIIGGMLGNLLRLVAVANMKPADRPTIFKDYWWYVQLVILAGIGGLFVYLYRGSIASMTEVLAVHIGASAPLIAQTLTASIPSGLGKIN